MSCNNISFFFLKIVFKYEYRWFDKAEERQAEEFYEGGALAVPEYDDEEDDED